MYNKIVVVAVEPAFWTQGPVPIRLLDRLAMDRPMATRACLETLHRGNTASVGGPPGCGRTTLAHQVAQAWPHATVLLDASTTPQADEPAWARQVLLARGANPTATASWQDVASRIRSPILFVVDGAPQDADWVRSLQETVPGAFLLLHDGGAIRPDDLERDTCHEFFAYRCRQAGTRWDDDAMEAVIDLAEGRPDAVQRIGHACLHGRPERITRDTVLDAASRVAHHLPHGYATRLAALSPARRALLRAMVMHPDETPTEWALRCGLPPRSVPVHLQRLCSEDRLAERVERGRYRAANPLIALHLKVVHGNPVWIYRRR